MIRLARSIALLCAAVAVSSCGEDSTTSDEGGGGRQAGTTAESRTDADSNEQEAEPPAADPAGRGGARTSISASATGSGSTVSTSVNTLRDDSSTTVRVAPAGTVTVRRDGGMLELVETTLGEQWSERVDDAPDGEIALTLQGPNDRTIRFEAKMDGERFQTRIAG